MISSPSLAASAASVAEVLFAAAAEVEAAGTVPIGHLDLLTENGYYGLFGPPSLGGVPEPEAWRIIETLASGCLATAFVWTQHHSAVRAVAASQTPGLTDQYLEPMCRGELRAGLALGGLRPGPPLLRATPVVGVSGVAGQLDGGGWLLSGEAPWVTGWGLVDLLHVAARTADDTIVWALVDARASASLRVEPLDLVAVTASRTVTLRFHDHPIHATQVTDTLPYSRWPARDAAGLRLNGSLALGLAHRCRLLLSSSSTSTAMASGPTLAGPTLAGPTLADRLAADVDAARTALDTATPESLPTARAAASELALRAAATLVTAVGARGILAGETPQRLLREAAFLLVFGSRPSIKSDLLRRLAP